MHRKKMKRWFFLTRQGNHEACTNATIKVKNLKVHKWTLSLDNCDTWDLHAAPWKIFCLGWFCIWHLTREKTTLEGPIIFQMVHWDWKKNLLGGENENAQKRNEVKKEWKKKQNPSRRQTKPSPRFCCPYAIDWYEACWMFFSYSCCKHKV